jgi:hypothetical protein
MEVCQHEFRGFLVAKNTHWRWVGCQVGVNTCRDHPGEHCCQKVMCKLSWCDVCVCDGCMQVSSCACCMVVAVSLL